MEGGRYESLADEPLGTKDKFCVEDDDSVQWLLKYARDKVGFVRGEDWVEWFVYVIAALLDIPVAQILPAACRGRRRSFSRKIFANDASLVHGNELLQRAGPDYDGNAARRNPKYSVELIKSAPSGVAPPASHWTADSTGFDALAIYQAMDDLVAGRDRHHLNWAAIEDQADFTCRRPLTMGTRSGLPSAMNLWKS